MGVRTLCLLTTLLMLASCGQTGPLYLPEAEPENTAPASTEE